MGLEATICRHQSHRFVAGFFRDHRVAAVTAEVRRGCHLRVREADLLAIYPAPGLPRQLAVHSLPIKLRVRRSGVDAAEIPPAEQPTMF